MVPIASTIRTTNRPILKFFLNKKQSIRSKRTIHQVKCVEFTMIFARTESSHRDDALLTTDSKPINISNFHFKSDAAHTVISLAIVFYTLFAIFLCLLNARPITEHLTQLLSCNIQNNCAVLPASKRHDRDTISPTIQTVYGDGVNRR